MCVERFTLLAVHSDLEVPFSDDEIAAQLDANFTGPIRCIRGALPYFRAQATLKQDLVDPRPPEPQRDGGSSSPRRPHGGPVIVNYSSGAALLGVPGRSLYCASKFALEGMTEALAKEVEHWGIRVFLVVPGAFKTPFSDTCIVAERGDGGDGEFVSEAYRDTPADRMVRLTKNMEAEGRLKGDPAKAAQRVVEAVDRVGMAADADDAGLFRLFLGSDCLGAVRTKMNALAKNYAAGEAVARSTDFV